MKTLMTTVAFALALTTASFTASVAEAAKLKLATDSGAKGSAPGDAIDAWAELIRARSDGEI